MLAGESGFVAWSPPHLGALVAMFATIAICAGMLYGSGRGTASATAERAVRRAIFFTLAAAIAVAELLGQVSALFERRYSLVENLPLHLCDLTSICAVVMLVRGALAPDRRSAVWNMQALYECVYFWGLAGGSQALLTPDLLESFPALAYFEFFVPHCAAIATVFILALGLPIRPLPGAVLRVWSLTVALGAALMPLNWLIGSNYMYTCGPPRRGSLYDYLGPWPWSLLGLMAAGLVIMPLVYLPYWLADRRAVTARRA